MQKLEERLSKLRHASGLSEAYTFKNISIYSDDGKKMHRFGLGIE